MELETRHIVFGLLAALAVGGGYAWYTSQPRDDRSDRGYDARDRSTRPEASVSAWPSPTLYKWKGDDGVWNYTDKPPSDRPYTAISGTPNVNSVPTVVPESAFVDETDESGAEPGE